MSKNLIKYTLLVILFELILVDQISKWLARIYLTESIDIFSFFRLHLAFNEGVAFSLPVDYYIIIPLTVIVLSYLGWELWRRCTTRKELFSAEMIAYGLIFSGAIGNLIDRLFFGSVTDFLSFWSFPIFNLADMWISLGVVVFMYTSVTKKT